MRKTVNYTVTAQGRDYGKLFVITEMPSEQGEWWAMRALLALANSGVNLPDGVVELGMAGLAEVGLKKLFALPPELFRDLSNELLGQLQIIPDPKRTQVIRALISEDIEEIATRLTLKWEVLKLHVDFSQAGGLSNSVRDLLETAKAPRQPVTRMSRK